MKTKHFFLLIMAYFCVNNAFSQEQISKEQATKVINAYKRNAKTFMNLEMCGNMFDGPAYVLKQTENYSLDRLIEITPEQETKLGAKIYTDIEEPHVVKKDQNLEMVRSMVNKLASYTSKPEIKYHVYIVSSDQVNAFSTIGGYIYITTGLLDFIESKDQLAFVLGHEISHIVNNHLVRKEKKIALLTNIGQKMNYQRFSSVALDLNMTLSAPFDQIDEYDADRSSIEIVKKAGYDESAFNGFFLKLQKSDRQDLLSRFTSTHPSSANRRKCLNKLIGQ